MEAEEKYLRAGISLRTLSALFLLLLASSSSADPGTSAATFLTLGFGARPLGVGEAFTAMADDVSALHYNPAGLALPAGRTRGPSGPYEMLFAHTIHIQDVALDQLGLVRRPFGVSVTSLRVGGIERRTTETLDPEGSFGASDLAIGLSFGHKVGEVGLGGTAKFIRQAIGNASAQAYAVDLGALRRFESMPLSVGAQLANLGTRVKFIDESAPLPLTLRTAITAGMTESFPHALSLQVDFPRDSNPVFRLGAEYLGFGPFALRVGYRTFGNGQREAVLGKALGSSASGLSQFYGLFMGVGVQSKLGNLDYSIVPYGELGLAHRISFSLRFGDEAAGSPGKR